MQRAVAEPMGRCTDSLAVLADELGATAFLTLAEGDEGVSAAVTAPRTGRVHVGYRVGVRHPLAVGAAGMAILAGRPAVPGERPEVEAARSRGYAVSADELVAGAWALAVPVAVRPGIAGASIGVVAMTSLDTAVAAAAVRRATDGVVAALGRAGRGDG